MNSIILTALANKCPLHSFIFHVCTMTKNNRPKSDKLGIKIVYHCILQVHSTFGEMPSCMVTVPTSFICCKARLDTSILSFACLHSMWITKIVANNEIITVTNRKTSIVKLLNFVRQFWISYGMPFFQIKNFLFIVVLVNKVF